MSQKEKLYVFPKYQEVEYFFSPCCKLIPYGLLNKSLPAEQEIVAIDVRADNQRLWNKFLSNINLNEYKYQYLRSRETLFYISEHLNQAGVFFAEKNLDDYAVELFRLASTVSSDETSSLVNESVFYLNTNNPDKAIEKLKEANSRNPTDAQVYKKLGLVYLQTNNHTDAYLYLKKYISFKLEDPDNLVITNFLANYENTN
jgi:tetratricopeptide (TPR) repeat protein